MLWLRRCPQWRAPLIRAAWAEGAQGPAHEEPPEERLMWPAYGVARVSRWPQTSAALGAYGSRADRGVSASSHDVVVGGSMGALGPPCVRLTSRLYPPSRGPPLSSWVSSSLKAHPRQAD